MTETQSSAQAMANTYDLAHPAALKSRHTERRAIDMTMTGYSGKDFTDASGKTKHVVSAQDLYDLGKTFGVIKLVSDRPHWSDDGH